MRVVIVLPQDQFQFQNLNRRADFIFRRLLAVLFIFVQTLLLRSSGPAGFLRADSSTLSPNHLFNGSAFVPPFGPMSRGCSGKFSKVLFRFFPNIDCARHFGREAPRSESVPATATPFGELLPGRFQAF